MREEAVIAATARTPIGRARKGSLANMRGDDLAVLAVEAARAKVPQITASEIDDLIMGCAQPAGEQGFNIARSVAVLCGLTSVPGVTVNRYCASSLQAIRMAAHAIRAGEGDCFIAAGTEAYSRFGKGNADNLPDTKNPKYAGAQERTAARAADGAEHWQSRDGLPDVYIAMGQTAENVAQFAGVTRAEMDGFALQSQQRAVAAQRDGVFAREITPVTTPDGVTVTTDDGPRPNTSLEALAQLEPVFRPDGTVTAGNSCPLNDGAAAVIVMSASRARELGVTPLARIVASGVSALDPEIMGLGPVEASRQALKRAGMSIDDIDLVEMNEAYAAQVIPSARELDVEWERLNVHGGAIALGHPFGMTGARIMTTLINALSTRDVEVGLETMCVGGGQGVAMVVERLS